MAIIDLRTKKTSKEDELLSVTEAKSFGVPYGTTRAEVFGMSPTKSGGSGISPGVVPGVTTGIEPRQQAIRSAVTSLPAGQQEAAFAALSVFPNAKEIVALLEKGVKTGPLAGRTQSLGQILSGTNSDFNKFKAGATAFTSNYIKALSGVQVSDRERQFLMGALPSENKQEQVNKDNIATLLDFLKNKYEVQLGVNLDKEASTRDESPRIAKARQEAAEAEREASRSVGSRVAGELGRFALEAPSRFLTSAVAAPVDVVKTAMGGQPVNLRDPLFGKPTFQAQAAQEIDALHQKAYDQGGELSLGDYGQALKPFAEVPLAAAETLGAGKLFTSGTGAARRLFSGRKEKEAADFIRQLVTPQQTTGKSGTFTRNIAKGRVEEGGRLFGGRTVAPDRMQLAVEEVVRDVPGLTKKNTLLQNSNAIHDEVGRAAQELRESLAQQDVVRLVDYSDIRNLIQRTKTELRENPVLVGDAEKTGQKILDKFASLLPKNRPINADDVLDARQELDSWMTQVKGSGIFDPKTDNAVSIALRTVRQGANDLMAEKAPDVAVKALLKRQSLLYQAIENIAPKASKEADTGFKRLLQRRPFLKWVGGIAAAGVVQGLVTGAVLNTVNSRE